MNHLNENRIERPITFDEFKNIYKSKIDDLNKEKNEEIALIYKEIKKVHDKYKKIGNEIKKESLDEISKKIKDEIVGKTVLLHKNNLTVIGVVKDVKAEFSNRIYIRYYLEDGRNFRNLQGDNVQKLDNFLNELKSNLGKEIEFEGRNLKELLDKLENKERDVYYFLHYNPNKITTILKKIEVKPIKNIGDRLIINDEYVFKIDYYSAYRYVNRVISEYDPLGEEDWENESVKETRKNNIKFFEQFKST